ncbi:MAG TPA: hypothetical protein VMI72_16085 [Roseiarcus sp.]|nr:hypothetical protein [Roseiarcus sp.]
MSGHGGRRPGAGRPKGSKNRAKEIAAEIDASLPTDPLSIALRAARKLEQEGKTEKAAALAIRLARYFNQPFSPSDQAAKPHPEQGILPLWESQPKSRGTLGKKAAAQLDAETAGQGTDWGDLLQPDRPN